MNRLIQIVNEEISAIHKDKDEEIFDYKSIIKDVWREIVKEAKDFQKIGFDLENDDSTGEKKRFLIKKNLRKDQPIKYEINAELFEAGGDWESPVLYFKLEFTHDYGIMKSDDWKKDNKPEFVWDKPERDVRDLHNNFVIIPPVEAGNKLQKGKDEKLDWYAYSDREDDKDVRITDADRKNCWKWLQELLEKLVNDRHEMLD